MKQPVKMPAPAPPYTSDVEDYIVQCGWQLLPQTIITDALVFSKGTAAIVLVDDAIEFKIAPANAEINAGQILFNWPSTHHYKGWDCKNMLQLMWLLHFMGAINLQQVNKDVRSKINMEYLTQALRDNYLNVQVTRVQQLAPAV